MEKVKQWLAKAGIRALKTFAQTAASLVTVGAVASEINWGTVFSTAAVAAVYSIFTSLAGLPEIKLENELEEINNANNKEE